MHCTLVRIASAKHGTSDSYVVRADGIGGNGRIGVQTTDDGDYRRTAYSQNRFEPYMKYLFIYNLIRFFAVKFNKLRNQFSFVLISSDLECD